MVLPVPSLTMSTRASWQSIPKRIATVSSSASSSLGSWFPATTRLRPWSAPACRNCSSPSKGFLDPIFAKTFLDDRPMRWMLRLLHTMASTLGAAAISETGPTRQRCGRKRTWANIIVCIYIYIHISVYMPILSPWYPMLVIAGIFPLLMTPGPGSWKATDPDPWCSKTSCRSLDGERYGLNVSGDCCLYI